METETKQPGALGALLARMAKTQKGVATNAVVAEFKAKVELIKEKEVQNGSVRMSNNESGLVEDKFCGLQSHKHDPKSLPEIDLLLIGKTGNGKSSLGNTILGYNAFESKSSLKSVTINVTYEIYEYNGYRIKVVDGPGIGDTRMDSNEATQFILKAMTEAISLSPKGFHAFLLVIKYGGRFTKEDKLTVDTLKNIFGEHFFKNFCIIVMTCGDKFQEDVNTSFPEWVKEQDHDVFTDLLKECDGRIVLFNNKTQDIEKKKSQLNELLEVIEMLKRQNCRYSDEYFMMALETRNVLLVESQKDLITDEIMDEANIVQKRLELILESIQMEKSVPFLHELYGRTEALYAKTSKSDMNTGVLTAVHQHVWSIMNTIRDHITISENLVNETDKMKKEREKHADELRHQKEEIDKLCKKGEAQDKVMIAMLQKQMEQMNEVNKRWDEKEKELEADAKVKWDHENQRALRYAYAFWKLREEQKKTTKTKISKIIATKIKDLFSKKK